MQFHMQGYHSALHCGVFRRNGGRESGSLLHFKHLTFLPINSQYKINIYIKSKNTTSLINQLYQKNGVFIYLLKLIPSNYFINDIAASSATIVTSECNLRLFLVLLERFVRRLCLLTNQETAL